MRTQRFITDYSLCLSAQISKSAISYILLTGKDLFSWEPGDDIDSGHGSSPSTPGTIEDSDSDIHLFHFEKGLQSNFYDELDSCLFDGGLPSKLYTHIKVVKEESEEDWERDISSFAFDSLSFPDDCFGEHSKLLEEIFTQPKINNEQAEKSIRKDNISEESVTEAAANSTTCAKDSTNTAEEAMSPKDSSSECSEEIPIKRQLRKRVRSHVLNEHDYFKSLEEEDNELENEFDDDEKEQKSEDTEDSDRDFEPPRGAAKKSRRTMNSKSDKDDKYWERRKRNNLAAKRSREAKRLREIETTKKTLALEKENANLKNQVRKLKAAIKRAEKRLRVMI